MQLLSIQTAAVRTFESQGSENWWDRSWTSGIFKEPRDGPVWLHPLGLEGDRQADLRVHGGPDKAICVYPSEHYAFWMRVLGLDALPHGAFGENFTVSGLLEAEVCIGDRFTIGGATLELSQPRQPCWKLARRWRRQDLAQAVEDSGRTGFYLRVIEAGWVAPKNVISLIARPHPEWNVLSCHRLRLRRHRDPARAGLLANCPALSASWRKAFASVDFAEECRTSKNDLRKREPQ